MSDYGDRNVVEAEAVDAVVDQERKGRRNDNQNL